MQWFIFFVLSLFVNLAYAVSFEGKVVGVNDGDTITIVENKTQVKVRLAQIDAPESNQAFGTQSKKSLSELVYGKTVKVVQEDVDRYKRVVGRVYVNSLDVNKEQVKRGMAWAYRQYMKDKDFQYLEDQAKAQRVGLWSDAKPSPPWEFRHGGVNATTPNKPNNISSSCGNKRRCSEMSTCEEAKFYLTQCSVFSLDRDKDGVPCESLCR